MSETVADYLLGRLRRVGSKADLRLSRRRDQRRSWAPSAAAGDERPSSFRSATRRWPRSWRARTPSSRARSASASPPPAPARSTCSTGCTTPSSTTSPSWRSSASRHDSALGGNYQQEVDLTTCSRTSRSEYVQMATEPGADPSPDRPRDADRARERTVTCVIVPNDLADGRGSRQPPHAHGTVHSGLGYTRPRVVPAEDEQLQRAAES